MAAAALAALAALALAPGWQQGQGRASIRSGEPWRDTRGEVIDAHGAGLLEHGGKYWWYGSRRTINATGTQMDGGIALYSSTDLYSWTFESVVVNVFNCTSNTTRAAVRSGGTGAGVGAGAWPASGAARGGQRAPPHTRRGKTRPCTSHPARTLHARHSGCAHRVTNEHALVTHLHGKRDHDRFVSAVA